MMSLDYSNLPAVLERTKTQLRDYQIECVARGIRSKNILLDMLVGSGKTWPALTIMFAQRPKKVLLISGRNSLGAWLGEIRERFSEYANPKEFNIIRANQGAKARKSKWSNPGTFHIATMQTVVLDLEQVLAQKFDAVVIDEAHKIPKHTTKTFIKLKAAIKNIPCKLMLTGTWIKSTPDTGWRQLHLLNPKLFPSYWKFVNRYCRMVEGYFGKEIVGPKNEKEFALIIRDNVFRFHDKTAVPQSTRKVRWIQMNRQQNDIYHELDENMMALLDSGELLISKVSIANFTKHRQLLNCPKLLSESLGLGNAFNSVMAHLDEHKDDPAEQHCVIFSPFRKSIPYFKEVLEARGYAVFEFVGGTDGEEVQQRSKDFRALKGKPSVALGTIQFAESFHLGTATRSHFIGTMTYLDPMVQAEGRLARADSDRSQLIQHNYWLYTDTIDVNALMMLRGRAQNVRKTFTSVDEMMAWLYAKQK